MFPVQVQTTESPALIRTFVGEKRRAPLNPTVTFAVAALTDQAEANHRKNVEIATREGNFISIVIFIRIERNWRAKSSGEKFGTFFRKTPRIQVRWHIANFH